MTETDVMNVKNNPKSDKTYKPSAWSRILFVLSCIGLVLVNICKAIISVPVFLINFIRGILGAIILWTIIKIVLVIGTMGIITFIGWLFQSEAFLVEWQPKVQPFIDTMSKFFNQWEYWVMLAIAILTAFASVLDLWDALD